MKRAVALLLLVITGASSARHRAVRLPAERILWVGAHPDDESLIAPLLGTSCVEGHVPCSLLVMTHGEHGECVMPASCGVDLGAIRASEMQSAASLLHSSLTLWTFSDVLQDVDASWSAEAGSHEALVQRIEGVITAEKPIVVYTFDPMHGSTCHPAHRATGALVLEAIDRLGPAAPRVVLIETAVNIVGGDFLFSTATRDAIALDATASWYWLVRDIEAHPSQFTPQQADAIQRTPPDQQRIFLLPAAARTGTQYIFGCP
jgi:LmbE family N-acetylglucosaminyl deacetylase